jgi:glycerophosphoryl diester phosphodiesterase
MSFITPAFDVQGHRGARGLRPENTLQAFRCALELGVTTLELDTVISADGQVVVSHEPWMSAQICSHPDGRRVAPEEAMELNIYRMDYEQIARFDCGVRGHIAFPRQQPQKARKPLLKEVFEMAEAFTAEAGIPRVHYNVETKSRPEWEGRWCPAPEPFVDAIWNEVREAGVAPRTILQSFDVRTLQVGRALDLPIRLSLLVESGPRGVQARPDPMVYLEKGLDILGFIPEIYSPHYRLVTPPVIALARTQGMAVIPWTVNEVHEMHSLELLGVAGLITDYPDLAVPALQRNRPSHTE